MPNGRCRVGSLDVLHLKREMRSKRLIHLNFVVLRPSEPHKEPHISGSLATEERTVAARSQSTASPVDESLLEAWCSTDPDLSSGHNGGRS